MISSFIDIGYNFNKDLLYVINIHIHLVRYFKIIFIIILM